MFLIKNHIQLSAPLVAGLDKHSFPLLPLSNKGNGGVDERMATKGMLNNKSKNHLNNTRRSQ